MNTTLLLISQYNGAAVIPVEDVCRDYFQHLSPNEFARKVSNGDIALPMVRIDAGSGKTARGVHLQDLAEWIDIRRKAAREEAWQLTGAVHLNPKREVSNK